MYGLLLDLSVCCQWGFQANPEARLLLVTPQAEHKVRGSPLAIIQSALPRKASKLIYVCTVPQTDTGDQLE